MASVIPSLRYSISGSPLAFENGKTSRESMVLDSLARRSEDGCVSAWVRVGVRPESKSRFRRVKSIRISAAFW